MSYSSPLSFFWEGANFDKKYFVCSLFFLGNLIQRDKRVAQFNKSVLRFLKDVLFFTICNFMRSSTKIWRFLAGTEHNFGFITLASLFINQSLA